MTPRSGVSSSGEHPRRPIVSGNWKMNHDHMAALHLVRDLGLRLGAKSLGKLEVSIHPPFSDLRTVQLLVEGDSLPIALGAQHCNPEDSGAFTGEVSPPMLSRLGVSYVIVGHSERRLGFGMSDEVVATTLRGVVRHQMVPILCVGETAEERQAGRTEPRLAFQLESAVAKMDPERLANLVVAYEPVWAIGAGRPASTVDASDAATFLRKVMTSLLGSEVADSVRIQYGGSVNAENAQDFVAEPDIDGLLVGGASLQAEGFADIVESVAACYGSSS
ncbi:MAG: triose-phosphate isomerase [Acidimicrobiales bacterium]